VQGSDAIIALEPSYGLGTAAVILLTLLIILWFVVSNVVAHKGGITETPNRMAQMYGYTVCLVAVILMLTSVSSIVSAAFDRANPLQSEHDYGASLVSFEAYRATYDRERSMMGPNATPMTRDTTSDETLQRRYAGLVEGRRAATMHRTSKSFVTSGLLLVVALGMFVVHWRWLGRMHGSARSA